MSTLQPSPDKRIIVTGPDLRPFHIGVGSLDTAIAHEEADVLMACYMIEEAKTGQPAIKVVSDDTGVLAIQAPPSILRNKRVASRCCPHHGVMFCKCLCDQRQ